MLSRVQPLGSTAPSNRRLPSAVVTKRMGDMVTPVTRSPPRGSPPVPPEGRAGVAAAVSPSREGVRKDIQEELSATPDTSPETLRVLNEALEELERTEGPAIRAGINGALNARGFEGLGDAGALGSFYRETVRHFEDVNSLYDHIQKTYGNNFEAALDFLYKALASDLAADMPSMETSHLEHVNGSLGELRQLQSARSLCARLLERWSSVHGIRHCPLDDMALLGKVLDLRKERYISGSRISRLAEEAGAPDIERKVLFLQELLNTTRSFAPSLFDGNEGRMKVLDAVQDAVDAAIAEEDAWLAEQG